MSGKTSPCPPAGDSLRDKLGLEVSHYLPWDTTVGHRVGSTLDRVGAHLQWHWGVPVVLHTWCTWSWPRHLGAGDNGLGLVPTMAGQR